ncbi:secreted ookinete adhesive protein, putative [Plasmodium knowlesi strain H]|uniref:Secreted ookinete adhesive protein, putative n=3 Tax=Plasmodium knowlesi TaxID=5850 RepID=A0A5K1VFH1_PLAKH|nr:secreted ookinete adhesive protein, putative [Plasmodium knowlesi strain H]OTN67613.1 putative SOAP [Plasmodium knowlesi]CAA9990564.1 secreted ookinete adhesive protein, putative [Plasmodium knowlesi strain H]SBO19827.1 secreted ookinete adhesive protein, putative [Plasmodium knowlesi strain H]SBO22352.1 secreted ookinete adhesive protein, putative [Plasmodium knowlesi strain H]VVS80038.1 secreted ookinete adhesive protein, putative [Plasmodium knowlesi strain H]|eukprot:XP_002260949.1 SOAP precursor, putative [Plasmodium knowlesi strain H]
MKRVLILLLSLLLVWAYAHGESSNIIPHMVERKKDTSATKIFSPRTTDKECIKCLPDNFCECECSCKNKTGFTMKYRHASKGSKQARYNVPTTKKNTNSGQSTNMNTKSSMPGVRTEDPPQQGTSGGNGTSEGTNTQDDNINECSSSCKSVTGVQTEECSCSCYC